MYPIDKIKEKLCFKSIMWQVKFPINLNEVNRILQNIWVIQSATSIKFVFSASVDYITEVYFRIGVREVYTCY